jgi:hypothetical protein
MRNDTASQHRDNRVKCIVGRGHLTFRFLLYGFKITLTHTFFKINLLSSASFFINILFIWSFRFIIKSILSSLIILSSFFFLFFTFYYQLFQSIPPSLPAPLLPVACTRRSPPPLPAPTSRVHELCARSPPFCLQVFSKQKTGINKKLRGVYFIGGRLKRKWIKWMWRIKNSLMV